MVYHRVTVILRSVARDYWAPVLRRRPGTVVFRSTLALAAAASRCISGTGFADAAFRQPRRRRAPALGMGMGRVGPSLSCRPSPGARTRDGGLQSHPSANVLLVGLFLAVNKLGPGQSGDRAQYANCYKRAWEPRARHLTERLAGSFPCITARRLPSPAYGSPIAPSFVLFYGHGGRSRLYYSSVAN